MKENKKILVGGKALNIYGSNRLTNDTNYLIFDPSSSEPFIKDEKMSITYLNGNGLKFFEEIFHREKENDIASAQSLMELKAYSYIQHMVNGNYLRAIGDKHDIAFLSLEFDLKSVEVANEYLKENQLDEIEKIIADVTKQI